MTEPGRALAVGTFDGVHLGHRRLLRRLARAARRRGLVPGALVLDEKPANGAGGGGARLLAPAWQDRCLRGAGIEKIYRLRLTPEVRSWPPERFAAALKNEYAARLVAVGANFRFGRDRAGDGAALTALGASQGFDTLVVPVLPWRGGTVSSSRIRDAIRAGDLAAAGRMLGRPPQAGGTVIGGAGRGRELGFPTANLAVGDAVLPPWGVYLVRTVAGAAPAWGVASWGTRPTFADDVRGPLLEVHYPGWAGDLAGSELTVAFLEMLRDEIAFPDAAALIRQMRQDVARAELRMAEIAKRP